MTHLCFHLCTIDLYDLFTFEYLFFVTWRWNLFVINLFFIHVGERRWKLTDTANDPCCLVYSTVAIYLVRPQPCRWSRPGPECWTFPGGPADVYMAQGIMNYIRLVLKNLPWCAENYIWSIPTPLGRTLSDGWVNLFCLSLDYPCGHRFMKPL